MRREAAVTATCSEPTRVAIVSERRLRHVDDVSSEGSPARRRFEELAAIMRLEARSDVRIDTLMSLAVTSLPLDSALLLTAAGTNIESRSWHASTISEARIDDARDEACAAYRELVDADVLLPSAAVLFESPFAPASSFGGAQRLSLPLTTRDGAPFGILRLVTTEPLDEGELAFAHVLAMHFAVAITRDLHAVDGIPPDRLSHSGERPTVIDENEPLHRLARALSPLATICAIDVLGRETSAVRILVAPSLALIDAPERIEQILDTLAASTGDDQRSGATVGTGIEALGIASHRVVEALGLHTWMRIPLTVEGRRIAVVTLLGGREIRPYTRWLARLVVEHGTDAAVSEDRERLYRAALDEIRHRDDVLAIVSHDLRGPIGAILLNAQSLATRCDDRQRRDVEAVRRAAQRMLHQITDLLDAASIHERRLSLELAVQPLAPIVAEQLEALRPVAVSRRITLELETDDALPLVAVDRERMHQILSNLVGNALKFTPPQGTIHVRLEHVEAGIRVSVADSGTGIPAASLPHVFDRYWHAPATAMGGTGLGLYIVQSLVAAHGARVTVASEPDAGTTFAFTIPAPR